MNEQLLCKCSNSMIAHKVTDMLESEGITFRQHDETNASHTGIYGPDPGIAIYVSEEDYAKALTLVEPVLMSPSKHTNPFCPRCGSEDIRSIKRSRIVTPLLYFSIFLFIAPMVYLYYSKKSDSPIPYYLSMITFVSSIIIMLLCGRKNADSKCNRCGKKFNRL